MLLPLLFSTPTTFSITIPKLATTQAEMKRTETKPPPLSDSQLLTEIQRRAFRFFWEQSDPVTGLTNDRAKNYESKDEITVASIASTGYALCSLPIAVQHHWIERKAAYDRVLLTLRYVKDRLPNEHGWYYHFIDKHTGQRVWNCELSSIDTALLMMGVLTCGQYWKNTEVERLATELSDRMDWGWMKTNGGTKPDKKLLSMGWKPETGFLNNDWDHYCELMFLYLLGMGAKQNPLGADSWTAWKRNEVEYGGRKTLVGGPIFMHQMAQGFFDFKDSRDLLGWDYWAVSREAIAMNRQYCVDRIGKRKTYALDVWGLNASDGPDGYKAYGVLDDEDGTVSPTGAIAALLTDKKAALRAGQAIYNRHGLKLWGRYGYGNAFNVDRNWFDDEVIGIDLGMAIVGIENERTGLIWRLVGLHEGMKRAWKTAGFHRTKEKEPRLIHR